MAYIMAYISPCRHFRSRITNFIFKSLDTVEKEGNPWILFAFTAFDGRISDRLDNIRAANQIRVRETLEPQSQVEDAFELSPLRFCRQRARAAQFVSLCRPCLLSLSRRQHLSALRTLPNVRHRRHEDLFHLEFWQGNPPVFSRWDELPASSFFSPKIFSHNKGISFKPMYDRLE